MGQEKRRGLSYTYGAVNQYYRQRSYAGSEQCSLSRLFTENICLLNVVEINVWGPL
jgi:hypothetical protein